MSINQWRAPCRYCGDRVGKRKGKAGRSTATGRWLVWHTRCEPADAPAAPTVTPYYADPDR